MRKILAGNVGSSNFAPTRRNGMAPPIAPSASHASNTNSEGKDFLTVEKSI